MMDAEGTVLYVGKAKNLKIGWDYFRKSGLSTKTIALVKRIAQIDVTVTETETEALILGHNLIKQYRPPFNILMRDDKSYPYLFVRREVAKIGLSSGAWQKVVILEFPSVMRSVRMGFLQKTFQVRQCEDVFKNRSDPAYSIKLSVARRLC